MKTVRWTEDDLALLQRRMSGPMQPVVAPSKPSKYRNTREILDGIGFHSRLEARRYRELKLLREAKVIRYFLMQVPFRLPGLTKHVVDFMIVENDGRPKFEDAKGHDHPMGSLKRRQVEELYGVTIELWPAR